MMAQEKGHELYSQSDLGVDFSPTTGKEGLCAGFNPAVPQFPTCILRISVLTSQGCLQEGTSHVVCKWQVPSDCHHCLWGHLKS